MRVRETEMDRQGRESEPQRRPGAGPEPADAGGNVWLDAPVAPRAVEPSRRPAAGFVRPVLFWLMLGISLYVLVPPMVAQFREGQVERGTGPAEDGVSGRPLTCNPATLPAHGATRLFEPAIMRRSDLLYSGLEIENLHAYPVVFYLLRSGGGERLLGVSVMPGQRAEVSVPVGHYGSQLFVGSRWCNDEVGFEDGRRLEIQGGFEIKSGRTTQLSINPAEPAAPESVRIVANYRLPKPAESPGPAAEVRGAGYLELKQRPDGHYLVAGRLNGADVTYILDTGATLVALSDRTAARAGIQGCTPHGFKTANGMVQGCLGRAAELSFGGFQMHDVQVGVMPNMADEVLLGMNVLRHFRIEQHDGTLRLTAPQNGG